MDVFDLQMNFRVVFKNQAQESAAEILGQMGAQRVLLVTDAGIQGAGLDQTYREALAAKGMEVAVFSGVEPNPTTANVEAGLALARGFQPQAFLGIGGGSVLDCAKGINILLNRGRQDGRLRRAAAGRRRPVAPGGRPHHRGHRQRGLALFAHLRQRDPRQDRV